LDSGKAHDQRLQDSRKQRFLHTCLLIDKT
jgi:hypothetical protein